MRWFPTLPSSLALSLFLCACQLLAAALAHAEDFDADLTYEEVASEQHYAQRLRPQIHYTPIQGHVGDATGMFYYKGEYHLFYMFDKWQLVRDRHKRWGHAVSPDMIHWTELPPVLDTLLDHKPGSGSGVVDWNNSAGLQQGPEKTLLIFYTDYERGSCIAYSHDRGRTWTRHENNPVLGGFEDIRDPTVFWYQPAQEWRMVRYEKRGFAFYRSGNLIDWKYLSRIDGYYECPDFLHLPVENSPDESRWVLIDGDGSYTLGLFDGTTFTAQSDRLKVDYGDALYATQAWKRTRLGTSRPVQMCWMRYPDNERTEKLTWNGQQSFPCELLLWKYEKGIRLHRRPVDEIKNLHRRQHVWNDLTVNEGENPLHDLDLDVCEIVLDMDVSGARRLRLTAGTVAVEYDVARQELSCLGSKAPLPQQNGRIHLQVLLDRCSIEVFGNDGRVSISNLFFPKADDSRDLTFFVEGGSAHLKNLEVSYLDSIWNDSRGQE
jgi:sucrose-6-phosphate hydrolase SacC (GH32 family)